MKELKKIFEKPCPKKLYHYTNKDAFKGIFSNQEMWATHIRFMNDAEEQKLAFDLLKKQLLIIFDKKKNVDIEKLQKNIEHFVFLEMLQKGIYILSFSEKKDDLGQWRGYGRSTPSFCLELDTKKFKSFFVSEPKKNKVIKNPTSFRIADIIDYSELNEDIFDFKEEDDKKYKICLVPCIYDPSEQIKLIDEILTDSYKRIGDRMSEENLAKQIAKRFVFYCPLIKNESFECESEWRVIILYEKTFDYTKKEKVDDEIEDENEPNESQEAFLEYNEEKYENIKGFLKQEEQLLSSREGLLCDIPFFKFKIDYSYFTKVLIGSCSDKDVVVDWTVKFLFDKGFSFASDMNLVEYTKIPYRSWKL